MIFAMQCRHDKPRPCSLKYLVLAVVIAGIVVSHSPPALSEAPAATLKEIGPREVDNLGELRAHLESVREEQFGEVRTFVVTFNREVKQVEVIAHATASAIVKSDSEAEVKCEALAGGIKNALSEPYGGDRKKESSLLQLFFEGESNQSDRLTTAAENFEKGATVEVTYVYRQGGGRFKMAGCRAEVPLSVYGSE